MRKAGGKIWKGFAAFLLLFLGFIFLNNTSLLVDSVEGVPKLWAHRALGQVFSRQGLTAETCTAAQMISSEHTHLENTIASMEAAFQYGADVVEFDVHQTVDDSFAVFHDWTLDCRTNGSGVTREHTLKELQGLDIGYGYTPDSGKTWPFRGKGVGLMPSLDEVLTTFPDEDFLIDIKSNDAAEGQLLAERLASLQTDRSGKIMVYGGGRPVNALHARLPDVGSITRPRLKKCLMQYMALGWSGYTPSSCDNSLIMVPVNYSPWIWGWPQKFAKRMENVGSQVVLIGDYAGEGYSQGIDDPERVSRLLPTFSGGIWTDRIDVLGPEIAKQHAK